MEYSETRNIRTATATVGLPTLGNGRVVLKLKFSEGMRTSSIDRMLVFLTWEFHWSGVSSRINKTRSLVGGSVLPALSIFLILKLVVEKRYRKMTPKTARNHQKIIIIITQDSVETVLFDLSLKYLLSNFIAEKIATATMYLFSYRSITRTTTESGPPVTDHNNICWGNRVGFVTKTFKKALT